MRKLFTILCLLLPLWAYSQTVHFIMFAATNDGKLGLSSDAALRHFKYNFAPSLEHVGFTVRPQYFAGNDFVRSNCDRAISNLNTSRNDVIIFYFTGHGFNDCEGKIYSSINDYPTLLIGANDGFNVPQKSKSEMEIFNTLKSKPHRLLLVMAEACNKCDRSSVSAGSQPVQHDMADIDVVKFKNLFSSTGDYLVSSSRNGEYSWSLQMGCFTSAFIDALKKQTGKSSNVTPTWNSIFTETASLTTQYAYKVYDKNGNACIQHPQFKEYGTGSNVKTILEISTPILNKLFRGSTATSNMNYGAWKLTNGYYFGEFENGSPKRNGLGFFVSNKIGLGTMAEFNNNTFSFSAYNNCIYDSYGNMVSSAGGANSGGRYAIRLITTAKGNYYFGQVDANGYYQGTGLFIWSDGRAWFGEWRNGQQANGGYIN